MATTIYVLRAPDGIEVRYVGKTVLPLKKRLDQHVYGSRTGRSHKATWIRSLGAPPIIDPVVVVPDEYAYEVEQRLLALLRSKGYRLVNGTDGGPGIRGHRHSVEARAKIGAVHNGLRHTEETKARIRKTLTGRATPWLTGRPLTDEHRARLLRMQATNTGRKRSPETCEKIGQASRGRTSSAATRALQSAAKKGRTLSAETRERMSAARMGHPVSAETRDRISAAKIAGNKARRALGWR